VPRNPRPKRLLVLLPWPASPFMRTDIALLRARFPVEVLTYEGKRIAMAWQVFRRIAGGRVGAVLFWFAVPSFGFGVSLIATLLRCPIVLITGGYDIANMPEIEFGSMIRPRLRRLVIGMLRMAHTVLTFSDYARRDVLQYARPRRLRTAYMGIDVEKFQPEPGQEREPLVVTASSVGHAFVRQKGLDTFVRAAAYVPEARFLVIGRFVDDAIDALRAEAPANVEFTGRFVSDEELVRLFQRARVYVQASLHEGFGVALAEAMAAGCVPVAVPATAMPEVVGDTGFYAPAGDAAAFGAAICRALADDGTRARAARARVVSRFTLARRAEVLGSEVGRLLARAGRRPGVAG
jgi:glycosyltransferase involved in cell wall biosynthesis